MAISQKVIEIRENKAKAAARVRALQEEVKQACNRVPAKIQAGDAVAAAEWRTKAEEIYFNALASIERGTDLAKSYSLNRLNEMIGKWEAALREIQAA